MVELELHYFSANILEDLTIWHKLTDLRNQRFRIDALEIVRQYPTPIFDLRDKEEPQQTSLPLAMMPMRSPNKSASSMKCLKILTELKI